MIKVMQNGNLIHTVHIQNDTIDDDSIFYFEQNFYDKEVEKLEVTFKPGQMVKNVANMAAIRPNQIDHVTIYLK